MSHPSSEVPMIVQNPDGSVSVSEEGILLLAKPTAAAAKEIFESLQLPEDVKGLKILDVGAGASNAVSELLRAGADAYAVDPRYQSMGQLKGDARRLIEYSYAGREDIKKLRKGILEKFKASSLGERSRYRGDSATALSFPDDVFDIVYSRLLIATYFDLDWEKFFQAVKEALRVTKPGGTVRLVPFLDSYGWGGEKSVNSVRMANNRRLIVELDKDPQVAQLRRATVPFTEGERQLLIIEKAS